jgi:hypothetical protein
MEDNGAAGEEIVMRDERSRLLSAKRPDLANRVHQISKKSVGEGYDMLSFETTGLKRYIEVKTTSTENRFFEMSANEWSKCCEVGIGTMFTG